MQCGAADVSGSYACCSSDCHTSVEVLAIILPEMLYDSVQQEGLSCDHAITLLLCMTVDIVRRSLSDAGVALQPQ